MLRQLSRDGFIYIGRSGVGLTYTFRKECDRQGTIAAIEKTASFHQIADRFLLELIATEGPRWVGYDRITEVAKAETVIFTEAQDYR
jgi:hypothetical protein